MKSVQDKKEKEKVKTMLGACVFWQDPIVFVVDVGCYEVRNMDCTHGAVFKVARHVTKFLTLVLVMHP